MIDRAPTLADAMLALQTEIADLRRQMRQQDYDRRDALLQEARAIERKWRIVYICPHCNSRVQKFDTRKDAT